MYQKYNVSKEKLERLYLTDKLTLEKIGELLQISPATIYNYLKKYRIKIRKPEDYFRQDLSNKKFGSWEVTSETKRNKKNILYWKCKCLLCKNYHWIRGSTLYSDESTKCKDCRRNLRKVGYKEISDTFWNALVARAKRKNIEFTINSGYAWDLYLKQERKCALSKRDINFAYKSLGTASLDRIDSKKGYIEGNVQWVHKMVNIMKNTYDQKDFLDMCKDITKNNEDLNE